METQNNIKTDEVTESTQTASNWELLILPTSYVPRLLKEIPKNHVAEIINSVASISERSSPYYVPPYTTIKENEILTMPHKGPIVFIYSLPGFGTTSLAVSLTVQIQQNFPNRWVAFINLRKCIKFLREKKQTGEEWTLAKLICAYSKILKTEQIDLVEKLLPVFDREEAKEKRSNVKKRKMNNEIFEEEPIEADLFIDEIDEIKQDDQKTFLEMLKSVNWNKCRARVWVTARYHIKPDIERILANESEQTKDFCEQFTTSFELLPLTRDEQILILFNYWKVADYHKSDPQADESLKAFATNFHNEMERVIPGFYKTIGASPKHLLMLPTIHASEKKHLDNKKQPNPHFYIVELSPVKLFQDFVKAKFECYLNKYAEEKPTPGAYKEKGVDRREFQRVQRLHVKAAMMWYNTDFSGNSDDMKRCFTGEQLLELYRVGIIYGVKGNSQFFHKMYAEFLLAQFFVDCGRLKNTGLLFINFFFSNILFDEQSKNVRKLFDAYLTLQQEKRKIKFICWARLRQFLMVHYRLFDDKDKESGETSAAADGGVVYDRENEMQGYTYEGIMKNGTILHLAIIEGHYKICQLIIDCFKGYTGELKKFLKMTVRLEIFPKNIFRSQDCEGLHVCNISSFHLMALFSIDSDFLGKVIPRFFTLIGVKGINKYFEQGTWTPYHFAAMNSNWDFLHTVFSQTKKLDANNIHLKNSVGQTPLHLVLHKSWYISLKIFDHPHPAIKVWSSATTKFPSAQPKKNVFVNCIIKVEIQDESTTTSKIVEQNTLARQRVYREIMSFEGIEKNFGERFVDSHIKMLQLFLDNGSNINATQDGNGMTIFDEAVTLGSEKIVDFLTERGAISIKTESD